MSQHEEPVASANWIQAMRTAQGIHVSLSQMADQKSSILMGATLVIFTITIGQATRGGEGPPLALLVLGFFAFVTAVLVMTATMPATGKPRPDAPVNLMFFGSFAHLDEEDYVARVQANSQTEEALRRLILHDLYQNGRVLLNKKYRLLGYAYRSFLLGLTLSLITFVASYFYPELATVHTLSQPAAL